MHGGRFENGQDGLGGGFLMSPVRIGPIEHKSWSLPVPPSYEQCVAVPIGGRTDYVVPPLAMAKFFWDEDDD